jgi:hypothetical protein
MTTMIRSLSLLAGLCALPAEAAESGAYAEFRAWIVGCDNVRTCRAYGFSAKDEADAASGVFLRIDRGGEASAEPELALSVAPDEPAAGTAVELSADGSGLGRLVFGETLVRKGDDDPGSVIRHAEVKKAILAALRKASTLTFKVAPAGAEKPAEEAVTVSLDGVMAALGFMDEQQKRGGNATALARPGERPASALPAPPALPPLAVLPHGNWPAVPKTIPPEVIQTWKKSECAAEQGANADDKELHRLGRDMLLAIMPCGAGAYNFSSAFFLYGEKGAPRVMRLSFDDPTRRPKETAQPRATSLVNASFDDEKLDISFFAKGRGIADCGSQGSYRFDGRAFRPATLATMPRCAGIGPGGWITVWRTRE